MTIFIRNFQYRLRSSLLLLVLFILTNVTKFQYLHAQPYSSNIEIIPKEVNLSVSSVANFICINHQQSPTSSLLEADLSKNISTEQIKLTKQIINETTLSIQLQLIDYIGYLHLLCYVKGEQSRGNLADIYVKDVPGKILLVKPCRVYDRKYMKCQFEAPTIARAIQNDYPGLITFTELPSSLGYLAYKPRAEFFKNESTDKYLVYAWKPNTEGVFPDKIPMRLHQQLEYFEATVYLFTISRVFVIEPKFTVETSWMRTIKIDLTELPSRVFCKKSIAPKLSLNVNRTWTSIDSTKKSIMIDDCLSDTIYEVCLKCREEYTDPDGPENCIEIKTSSLPTPRFVIVIVISCTIFAVIIAITILLIKRSQDHVPVPPPREFPMEPVTQHAISPYENDQEDQPYDDVEEVNRHLTNSESSQTSQPATPDVYIHISTAADIENACDAKILP